MSKSAVLLFLILLSYNPHTCRTQSPTGTPAPVIIALKNILAMTAATVKSANIDAAKTQVKIRKSIVQLQQQATVTQKAINAAVNDAMTSFRTRVDAMNSPDVAGRKCVIEDSAVELIGAKILEDATSCVSKTVKSMKRELNDTYYSIESALAKINSDQSIAETCVAEYYKTEMVLLKAILTGLCVTQSKERILTSIKDELSKWNDAAFIHALYTDGINRLSSCKNSSRISSIVNEQISSFVAKHMFSICEPNQPNRESLAMESQ